MITSNEISLAAAVLAQGGLVAFPTETVYGLGADATSDRAVAEVYAAKGRPQFNPLIVHVPSLDEAVKLGLFDDVSLRLARALWPGPLTLVVPRAADCPVSLLASAGLETIALRVPSHPVALDLLRAFGKPVVAPSANPSGRISPTTAQHVRDGLGSKVHMVLDGGACQVGLESTVVRSAPQGLYLLRAGGIGRRAIEDVTGQRLLTPEGDGSLHSPGQLASHYAPQAKVRLNALSPKSGEIYLGFGEHQNGPFSLSRGGDPIEAAAKLFALLHEIDALSPAGIAVAPIPMTGLGEAINDRLARAAVGSSAP